MSITQTTCPMIGIIEDDPIMGESLLQRLQLEGYQPVWWQSAEEAIAGLDGSYRVLVCDIRLPDMDGEQFFRHVLRDLGATPVVFVTAFGEVEQAVRLMRAGADDYITKPFAIEVLLDKIATLCTRKIAAGNESPGHATLGASPAMRGVEAELLRIKDMATPVLILGETGVGKEVAARQIHESSLRRDLPFVVVSCAAIPLGRAESEMFGHERGAGSRGAHLGLVEQAGAGTLFLDEVAAMPLPLQGKLLRLLEDGTYRRVGGDVVLVSQARIISSSNTDLQAQVATERFRADLYFRLNANELHIPPLRSRPEDIIPLSQHFFTVTARRDSARPPALTPAAVTALRVHAWPGNIRELRNRVERAFSLCAGSPQIAAEALFPEQRLRDVPANRVPSLAEAREQAERLHIEGTLRRTNGSLAKAADLLGVSRTTLWDKIRKLGLSASE